MVDIQLRNGWIIRNVESVKFRWKPWGKEESAGDIVRWQKAKGGDRKIELPETHMLDRSGIRPINKE